MVDECGPLVCSGSRQAEGEVGIVEAAVAVFPSADHAHFSEVGEASCDFLSADPFRASPAVAAGQQVVEPEPDPVVELGPPPLDGDEEAEVVNVTGRIVRGGRVP